ncbi:MAG TPA: hypothetical protein DHW02_00935 [Ktedonobacter sp.]|nr:hypothetical protein [Ktedonobacter sp.]
MGAKLLHTSASIGRATGIVERVAGVVRLVAIVVVVREQGPVEVAGDTFVMLDIRDETCQ